MKEIFKNGGKLYLKTIVINLMCFFIVVSFSVLATAVFTKNIGYIAYGTKGENTSSGISSTTEDTSSKPSSEEEKPEELYTYYFKDGDDTKKAEYEKQGYKITTNSIRSQITGTGTIVFLTVSQIFSLMILIAFIYPNLWHDGTTDSNLIKFKHKTEDKLKGFKIGLIAVIPHYLFLIFLVIAKVGVMPDFPVALYKFMNSSVYSFIDIIAGGATSVSLLAGWRLALLFVLPVIIPLTSGVAYLLGLNNFSIGEKIVYKKK